MKAHELLSDKSKWTQGAYAKDAFGNKRQADDKEAVCFCLTGAIRKCYRCGSEEYVDAVDKAWREAWRIFPWVRAKAWGLPDINDELGYDAVMEVLRAADV